MQTLIEQNPIVNNLVFQESIKTEQHYNNTLTLLETAFGACDVSNNPNLSNFKRLITPLKVISDQLLANVLTAVDVSTTDGSILREQRKQLITAFFKAYKDYAQSYNDFCAVTKKSPEHAAVASHLGKQGLESLLIQPIQRGPRYMLLIAETAKNNKHVDETNLNELDTLLSIVKDFLASINQNVDTPKSTNKEYELGDHTKALIDWVATVTKNHEEHNHEEPNQEPGYQFGDGYRWGKKTLSSFFSSAKPTPKQPEKDLSSTSGITPSSTGQ